MKTQLRLATIWALRSRRWPVEPRLSRRFGGNPFGRLSFLLGLALLICLGCTHPKPKPPVPPPTPEPTLAPSPTPEPTPALPRIGFGFMFSGADRYGDASTMLTWPSHTYLWAGRDWPNNGDDIPYPDRYAAQLAAKAQAAKDRGLRLWVCLGRERDIDPLPILDALKPFALLIDRWDIGDEVPDTDWSADRMTTEIAWLKGLMAERGFPTSIPFGAIFGQGQILGADWRSPYAGSGEGIRSLERPTLEGTLGPAPKGHTLPPGWSADNRIRDTRPAWQSEALDVIGLEWLISQAEVASPEQALEWQAHQQLAKVPAGKRVFVVLCAYTRNGAIDDACLIPRLWEPTFRLAMADPRVVGIQPFSFGRPYGLRDQIEPACPGALAALQGLAGAVR